MNQEELSQTFAYKSAKDYADKYLDKLNNDFVNQVGEELLKSVIIDVYLNAIQNTLNEVDAAAGCPSDPLLRINIWKHFYNLNYL